MNLKEELCKHLIDNNLVEEFDVIKHSYSTSRMNDWEKRNVETNNISPTLDTRCDCLGVVVRDGDDDMIINPLKGKTPYGWHFEQNVYDVNGEVRSVKAAQGSGNILKIIEEEQMEKDNIVTATLDEYNHKLNGPDTIDTIQAGYPVQNHGHRLVENPLRIRKLTPTECFRLMAVKDEDSCELEHLSNSTKYHLAGDSIVVNVLQAIFKSVLVDHPVLENKPIRLIEMFSGYGSQALALKYLGIPFESWRICEWAIKSIDAYKHIHFPNDHIDYSMSMDKDDLVEWLYNKGVSSNWNEPMKKEQIARKKEDELRQIYNNIKATNNLVNIQQVHTEDLEIENRDEYNYVLTYSFPCFTKDSLVLTDKGYKHIIDVTPSDRVVTHNNVYKPVTKFFDNGVHDVYKINAMSVDEIKATANHRFYVREMYRKGHFSTRCFKEPVWKELKNLTKKDYLGIPVNQYSIVPHFKDLETNNEIFWWLIGRYIGDGWYKSNDSIIICCNKSELDEITSKISGRFKYNIYEERTVYKIYINEKNIGKFVLQFGQGAINKHLTNTIIDLPKYLLEHFLNGYFSADGCQVGKLYKATTISRELAYGVGSCIAKVYHTPYRLYKTARPKKCIIENRVVNQHDTYQIVFKKERCKQDKAFYEDDYIWYPIKDICYVGKENVYDIEVDGDHSFTVQNTIVHNCQDLSLAGKGAGMEKGSGTRSGMLWEVERILEECGDELPQLLLMENVPQVAGSKNKEHFEKWIEFLESKGYTNKWCMLNAKEVGYPEPIPQNRNRCFMVSVLDPKCDIVLPEKTERTMVLKDLLEHNVDEKYYLSEKQIDSIRNSTFVTNKNRIQEKDHCSTLCARDWKDPKCVEEQVAEIRCDEGIRTFKENCCGSLRTIDACGDKVILIKEATKQGYKEAHDGDGVNICGRMKYQRGNVQEQSIQSLTTIGGNERAVVLDEDKWSDLD